jgi:polysaccharide export outer membrane protein
MGLLTGNAQPIHQMTTGRTAEIPSKYASGGKNTCLHRTIRLAVGTFGVALLAASLGCQSPDSATPSVETGNQPGINKQPDVLIIREGDTLNISFPGTPSLDKTQQVRRDGRVTLPLGEEMTVTGMTPVELEQALVKLYGTQLVSKEVTVTVVASSFEVYVSGLVVKPGIIQSDHPLSALEAIMRAGGFDPKARPNTEAVVVIRNEGGKTHNYILNLRLVIEGKQSEPFYLKPSDMVYVPEKFSWF